MAQPTALGSQVIGDRLRAIRSLPPGALYGRAAMAVSRRWQAALDRQRDKSRGSYAKDTATGALGVLCDPIPTHLIASHKTWIESTAALYAGHRFDLLGSGWVRVAYGMECAGTEGICFASGPRVVADPQGDWLAGRIHPANLAESRRIWQLISPPYDPLDWQLDFKSGFRWSETRWSGDIAFGDRHGADIKVPWELARMQHLLVLVWAHRLCPSSHGSSAEEFLREFRNQVLDFIATNPPRHGVNWCCAMDVAIRAANWVLAFSLFRAHGAAFDRAFETVLERSLLDHARHIASHLETYPEGRANHYFADIAGLLFITACLPKTDESDAWLAFAVQELVGETAYQFNADGSNFEGSTSYHRLSLEMATYATALVLGLPSDRLENLPPDVESRLRTRPKRPLARPLTTLPPDHGDRLTRGAIFTSRITRPDGTAIQIGDNDSGRFFKPHPVLRWPATDSPPNENHLDHNGVISAVQKLVASPLLAECAETNRLDAALATALSRGAVLANEEQADRAARCTVGTADDFKVAEKNGAKTVEIVAPGGNLRDGLALFGYPDFGLWIFRSHRMLLAVRCGATSSPRAGGSHAHNDQLGIDLTIDDNPWIADPGSYLYCPPLENRNRWRSVTAHAAPQWPGREPNSLDLGAFRLRDETRARCLYFGPLGFAGEHSGYGTPVRRLITLNDNFITITDSGIPTAERTDPVRCVGMAEARRHFALSAPFSPGYGEIECTATK